MNDFLPKNFYIDGLFFVAAMMVIMVLEKCLPAKKNQPLFSNSLFQDSIWFSLAVVSRALVTVLFAKKALAYVHFQPFEMISGIPHSFRFVFGVLAADFLARFHHRLQHGIPFLWSFHQVHHSQIQLNSMTAARIHIVDYLLLQLCLIGPLVILDVEASYISSFIIFVNWQSRFCHANIKTRLGFLRFLFVTPQSHRIHHSVEGRHLDRNFGITFSFWDRFFGTQSDASSVYPAVGIIAPTIPVEDQNSFLSMIRTPFLQLIYPFISIGRGLVKRRSR